LDLTQLTFYTVADRHSFPGLVALLNSLRLSGNDGRLVVLHYGCCTRNEDCCKDTLSCSRLRRRSPRDKETSLPSCYPRASLTAGQQLIIDAGSLRRRSARPPSGIQPTTCTPGCSCAASRASAEPAEPARSPLAAKSRPSCPRPTATS